MNKNKLVVSLFVVFVTFSPGLLATQYEEVMRRLPLSERSAVEDRVSKVTEPEIERMVAAISNQNWHDTLFDVEGTYAYQALAALKKEMITKHQFGTIMLYWINFSADGIRNGEFIPLFRADGSVNPRARTLILRTFRGRLQKFKSEESLVEEIKKYPKSEQCFFVRKKRKYSDFSIIASIEGPKVYLFHDTADGNIMIPSLGLMQAFLDVRFKEQAVKINPVLGLSSEDDIRNNGLTGTRDIALHFPQTTLPSEADGLPAFGYDFTYHDFFHALVASNAPIEHRRAFIEVADALKLSTAPYAKALATSFIDMEAASYKMIEEGYSSKDTDLSNSSFWVACLGFHVLMAQADEKRAHRFEGLPPPDAMAGNILKLLLSDEEKAVVRGMTKIYPVSDETRSFFATQLPGHIDAKSDPMIAWFKERAFITSLLEG